MQYYPQNYYLRGKDDRGILLPLLVGAAVGFPFGYIASNTNKNNYQIPYQPYSIYPVQQYQFLPYPYIPY